jgi:uncharacterized membrane protein
VRGNAQDNLEQKAADIIATVKQAKHVFAVAIDRVGNVVIGRLKGGEVIMTTMNEACQAVANAAGALSSTVATGIDELGNTLVMQLSAAHEAIVVSLSEAGAVVSCHVMAVVGIVSAAKPTIPGGFGILVELTTKLKILVTFGQVLGIAPTELAVPWPDDFYDFLNIFYFFNFDFFGIVTIDCVVGTRSFYTSFFTSWALPFILCLLNYIVYFGRAGSCSPKATLDKVVYERLSNEHSYFLLFGLFLIYPSVSSDMMRLFRCDKIYDDWLLTADVAIECFDGFWNVAAVFGAIGLVGYTLGIPAYFYWRLWSERDALDTDKVKGRYGFLYDSYKYEEGLWGFESALMLYKASLSAVVIFLREDSSTQVITTFTVAIVFCCFSLYVQAFADYYDDVLHCISVASIAVTMFSAILIQHAEDLKQVAPQQGDPYDMWVISLLLLMVNVGVLVLFVLAIFFNIYRYRTKKDDAEEEVAKDGKGQEGGAADVVHIHHGAITQDDETPIDKDTSDSPVPAAAVEIELQDEACCMPTFTGGGVGVEMQTFQATPHSSFQGNEDDDAQVVQM